MGKRQRKTGVVDVKLAIEKNIPLAEITRGDVNLSEKMREAIKDMEVGDSFVVPREWTVLSAGRRRRGDRFQVSSMLRVAFKKLNMVCKTRKMNECWEEYYTFRPSWLSSETKTVPMHKVRCWRVE
jgi:hypothetical protein